MKKSTEMANGDWYIETKIGYRYFNVVEDSIKPYMEYFYRRLFETEFDTTERSLILNEMNIIVKELPFFSFKYNSNDFWINYNSDVNIRFNGLFISLIRHINLNKILK